jgi:hypothetical protein
MTTPELMCEALRNSVHVCLEDDFAYQGAHAIKAGCRKGNVRRSRNLKSCMMVSPPGGAVQLLHTFHPQGITKIAWISAIALLHSSSRAFSCSPASARWKPDSRNRFDQPREQEWISLAVEGP